MTSPKKILIAEDEFLLDVFLKNNTCGIDVAQNLREKGENCPIIFTTGNSYDQTKNDIKNISNCQLLIKPIDIDQLLVVMHEMYSPAN